MNHQLTKCEECRYLQEERAGIHQFEGKAPKWRAEELASSERCAKHRELTMAEVTQNWARKKWAGNAEVSGPAANNQNS